LTIAALSYNVIFVHRLPFWKLPLAAVARARGVSGLCRRASKDLLWQRWQNSLDKLPILIRGLKLATLNRAVASYAHAGATSHILLTKAGRNSSQFPSEYDLGGHAEIVREQNWSDMGVKSGQNWGELE
jgi:hypothetical protein